MYNPIFTNAFVNMFLLILALWTIPWKVYALWTAAKHNHKKWFVALIILNTVGILEIFYIFKIVKKKWVDVKKDFKNALSSIK
ncbi:hypothetical protein A2823_01470 [Candidatus Nomurabacteria bacterium RIFCSPHIGHO2_01_FULL_41_91]|uniref:DUF5652 domain-containing protein n=1 Tax=Candidatus Nomurabacteria bacterium RIFCSPLOWO2_12_FULL_41_10 TaxID=1801795 RepID=A0A1F6YCS1_9BACT|nr:MAG: hypothetical protein A2823_01470 [Candidatus Nomurabacteria bacterium RIFCSPHIGHO2_01_FULL_41_91]OGI80661.1 MAG: hypothetical protein A3D43_00850 [Candidatus Nomurabacteria bacterium RIFCSPHIGHO2_02_FULL_41_52]OGI84935.1 MAG: hypothetical protein A3F49_00240 [Candidatus Nomurabacteria bacterium RIFCSPHIGHO2_12_FULL_42_19]OGI93751.1 MAG: hypothetical protein A3A07_02925 [Candidatus Nomurabacteria bacterium RIFCSPLOWO2_01_FULL_41_52]OGI98066.1 MAG: hypothetical protein A3H56_02830 [Candid